MNQMNHKGRARHSVRAVVARLTPVNQKNPLLEVVRRPNAQMVQSHAL